MSPTPTASPSATATPIVGVAGQVVYYSNHTLAVNGATVQLQDMTVGAGSTAGAVQTDATGQFSFPGIGVGNWEVQPQKIGDLSAVDIIDAISILNVTSGLQTLTAPQQLACDVSGDGSVDILDAILILQYTVGLTTRFPVAQACNSDWAFIPQPTTVDGQQLIQPQVAGSCRPGAIGFQPLSTQADNQNFLGVLFGDCNGSWQPSPSNFAPLVVGPPAPSELHLGRQARHRGKHILIPVKVDTAENFRALTAQIRYDASQLVPVGVHALGPARQALMQVNARVPGSLRIALASGQPLPKGAAFVLEFQAKHGHSSGAASVHIQNASVKH